MKSGIDYFPLDVSLDDKFELIEAEFGLTGFAVVVKLLQKIYGGQGYYCEWTYEVALLFGKKIGLGGNVVSEIIQTSIKRGIFDKKLYDKYHILTSAGIQKRYFEAVSRRKAVSVKKEYLLVPCAQNFIFADISSENVYQNEENAYISEQSKGKKSKGKKSKENSAPAVPAEAAEEWAEYKAMRIRMHKPMTAYAEKLMLKKLSDLAPDDVQKQKAILNQSIAHGWQGLFELKTAFQSQSAQKKHGGDDYGSPEDFYR